MESLSSVDLSNENIPGTLWAQLLQLSTDCFEVKMCMQFGYNPLIIFPHFFCFMNLVFYRYEMLSKCVDSGYLVGATPLTVFHRLF